MKLQHKKGDLLQAPEYYKVHQTNCKGVMGRGIAKQVKEQFPKVFREYRFLCEKETFNANKLLGLAQCVPVENGIIVNLFGEDGYGESTIRHTNYEAFYKGLETLRDKILTHDFPKQVAFPYKIGSALGGGDWNVIYPMIVSVFENTDIEVTIYEFNPDK